MNAMNDDYDWLRFWKNYGGVDELSTDKSIIGSGQFRRYQIGLAWQLCLTFAWFCMISFVVSSFAFFLCHEVYLYTWISFVQYPITTCTAEMAQFFKCTL
jgi:hypothetical protein